MVARGRVSWATQTFALIITVTQIQVINVFTTQFEDKSGTHDWFGTNKDLLCYNKNWWCLQQIPLSAYLTCVLLWAAITHEMSMEFHDSNMIKLLQPGVELNHDFLKKKDVDMDTGLSKDYWNETYQQALRLLNKIYIQIFLPCCQVALTKVASDDISTVNAILTVVAVMFILSVYRIL